MNKEEKEEEEKRIVKDRISDHSQVFQYPSPASTTSDHQESKKSGTGNETFMASLTATYWG